MDIEVKGGQVISGVITPSGSKNSAVALIPASLLFDEPVTFENVPDILDVTRLVTILSQMGSEVNWQKDAKTMTINTKNASFSNLEKKSLGNIRGTSLLWGPMLARFKKVSFDELPGGCTLGFRSLEPHYKAFRDLGVVVNDEAHRVDMDATKLTAKSFWLEEASPTATENALMLATAISGKTRIVGAACEPQVQDLCNFLVGCGAKITGIGSNIIEVTGGIKLAPKTHRIAPDHYEIATFLAMGAVTGGRVEVAEVKDDFFYPIQRVFSKFGITIAGKDGGLVCERGQKVSIKDGEGRGVLYVKAQPWPALPVDILPLFIPLALSAKVGQVLFHNWMYEAGLFWTSELQKLGATIVMSDPHRVMVVGGSQLKGATMEAPYIIRAVVAMVMAAMIAQGESTILNADALYRGHPHFSDNLKAMGAHINEIEPSRK